MTIQLTFLFTDLENSTGLWQQAPLAMQDALARHDAITQAAVKEHNGRIVKTTGDGLHAAFESAVDGVLAALAMQQGMAGEDWPQETGQLKIRIGLHSGESQERAGDYYGSTVNTAARVMDLGHGGQILLSEVTVLLLRGQGLAGITFAELGSHRLKGLAQPVTIYQLNHADLAHEFPPLRSASVPKHNLPVEITPLVGRQQEIQALSGLLADPKLSLFSIVAPGGTGKSHLALELGRRMVEAFANGVYFVELAAISAGENIVPAVAEAVGYQFQQNGRSQKQQILDYMANKQMLLIMDNYEHLLDSAGLVTEMLQTAAGLKILVTSRYRLNLQGEMLFTLHGLSLPEMGAEDAAHSAAVELFEQSARRARPDFAITAENLSDIVTICRLVYGMPLGILLAAAWVSILSTAEIAGEIQQGLDILEAEGNELPERQRSVRAVFDQAWSMMSAAEQDVFMNTSVFRGGFTREAGRKVTGAGLRQLQSLVNKALLEHSAGQGRFLTHELLRQFAAEKLLQSGEDRQVRDNHAAFYLTYLAQQTAKLKGSQQLQTLDEIEGDFDNLREAWENAARNRAFELIEQALEPMYLFCFLQSRLEDGRVLFEKARQGLVPEKDEAPRAVWQALGIRFFSTTENQRVSQEHLEASLARARERDDEMEMAYCLDKLATLAHYVDQNLPQAIAYYEEGAAIYRRLGERYYLAQIVSKLGEAHQLVGQAEPARKYVNEAIDLQRQIGDYIGESDTLRALSMTTWQNGNYDQAIAIQEEALVIQLQIDYMVGQATSNLFLGLLKFFGGQNEVGRAHVQLGLDQALEIADFSIQAWCYTVLSIMNAAGSDFAGARDDLERAEAITTDPTRQIGAGNPALHFLANVVRFLLEVDKGDFESARTYLLQPLNLGVMTASPGFMTVALCVSALVFDHDGRAHRAVELLGLTLSEPDSINSWLKQFAPLIDLQSQLQDRLGQDEFSASWERGRSLESKAACEQVLKYIASNSTEP